MELKREIALWQDYELLDSGNGEKCERFGEVIIVRPDPQALWNTNAPRASAPWQNADAQYSRQGREGEWQKNSKFPKTWNITWQNLVFEIQPTSFKHLGIFPEQAINWQYLKDNLKTGHKVLNLFGYTGGATLASLSAQAEVTHVDASKPSVNWAKRNAELSGVAQKKVRWIVDDAGAFVAREARRNNLYDVIVLDPPAFGRGPKGELWQFEDHLPDLLENCGKILNKDQGMLILNAYSLGFPALAVEQLLISSLPFVKIDFVSELVLQESTQRGFLLPGGITVRALW